MKKFNNIAKIIAAIIIIIVGYMFYMLFNSLGTRQQAWDRGYKQGVSVGYDSAMRTRIHVIVDTVDENTGHSEIPTKH